MEPTPPTADTLPPRLQWFAPWRWRRRWQMALLLVLTLGYPLSAGPLIWLHDRQRLPQFASPVLHVVYFPLEWAYSRFEWCQAILGPYLSFWESLP